MLIRLFQLTARSRVAECPRPSFPRTLRQFQLQFASEEACQEYLAACRWSEGYKCPRCAHDRGYALVGRRRWQCAACRHQVSLTSGTILDNTKTPLTLWFWAAYLMTTDKRGVSALLLQHQLGLQRYETAWMILHKLRRATVNAAREPLHGEVEIDDTWVGGTQAGIRGSRQLRGRRAALVVVAVEKRGRASGRTRMAVIPDFRATTISSFITQNVAPGSTIHNRWPSKALLACKNSASDRKSTRLNSSHDQISYAVFCLKKKKKKDKVLKHNKKKKKKQQ